MEGFSKPRGSEELFHALKCAPFLFLTVIVLHATIFWTWEKNCTYGTLISISCQWMLDGLFIYLFGSSLNKFIKLNPQKDTQCIRPFQKFWDFCSLLSWKRHSCTTQGWYVLKSYLLLPRQTVICMVTQVVLTFFCAVNFVLFFMWSITMDYCEQSPL